MNSGWNSTKGWTITPSSAPKNSQVGIANVNTKIQGIGTTFKPSSGDKFFYLRCNWQKTTEFKVSQKLSGELPVGVYKLTCKVAPFSSQGSVTDYKLSLGDGTTTATNKLLNKGSKWREWSVVFYKSDASKDLTIEAYMKPNADGGGNHYCMLLDDFTLSYESVKDYANMCLNADEYKNISGEEKTSLQTAINTGSEEEIFKAVSTFTSAKSAYDNYAEEAAVAEKFGLKVEAPATAAAATEALKTLNVAEYNAATKDYTAAIELGEWTTTGASKFSNEHWSGETRSYLNQDDSNNQGWNSNSWTMTCKQTLTLPAGKYVFKAAGRKSEVAFMKLSVKNGETVVGEVSNFPNGNVGLGITTDGKASFDSNDQFANKNNGRGWQWRFVPFTLDDDTQITFDIEAGADVIHNWASFGDYTVMAKPSVATSTAAYNQAVKAANEALAVEANKVVTGDELTKLNAALSADKGTTMESIDAATKNIQECATAFTAAQPKYQALVDAKKLEQEELAYASKAKFTEFTTSKEATATTAADAETKANAIISARRAYVESNGMAEGVKGAVDCTEKVVNPNFANQKEGWNEGQDKKGTTLIGETWTNADGTKGGYYYDYYNKENNMYLSQTVSGLAAGKYIVTVKARASQDLSYMYVRINGNNATHINAIDNTGGVFDRGWSDYTTEFTVGDDGQVIIAVGHYKPDRVNNKGGWFGFGDVRLVRLSEAVTLDEAADNVIEAKEAADVTLKRKFVANKWNTLVLPFAVSDADVKTTFGADAKVVVYSNADDANINFTTSTKGIEANVPVLIMPAAVNSTENTYTFNSVSIVAADTPKADGTSYSFVGSYKPYDLVNDDYMLYADKWWKTETGDTYKIKAFRAYIKAKTPAAAKQLNLVIDGQTTGLKLNTVNGNIEGETYNIAGQRVANSYKGLIIKNGKKIIKK